MRPKTKYGNRKVVLPNGEKFDSMAELKRWNDLQWIEKSGEIQNLERQVTYELQPKFRDKQGVAHRAITYKCDYQYIENGVLTVEDMKGFADQKFPIKEKLFRYKYPNIIFKITKAK